MIKKLLIVFILWKLLVLGGFYVGTQLFSFDPTFTIHFRNRLLDPDKTTIETNLPYLITVWGNFDGYYYNEIAKRGYFDSEVPFFPLYPILIHLLSKITTIPAVISGQIISNISFFFSLVVISKLINKDQLFKINNFFLTIAILIMLFPTSFYYGAIYNDSVFFLFASLSLLYARKGSFVISSIFASLATLGRLNGLTLFFYIVIEYITRNETKAISTWNIRNFTRLTSWKSIKTLLYSKISAVFLVPIAFVSYLIFIHIKFGNWYMLFLAMSPWGQDNITIPLQVVWRYLKILFINSNSNLNYWIAASELSFFLIYALLLIYSFRKIRFSYWMFFFLSVLIPSLTGTFQGMPRYGLHLYPFFMSLTLFLFSKNLSFRLAYFIISTILLIIFTALFTSGHFVA